MKFSTFVPEGDVLGALIWLSGLTCTDENFIAKAGAQKHLAEAGLMVICPDTSPRGLNLPHEHEADDFGSGASFYLDALTPGYRDHYRMETYVAEELHALVTREFKVNKIGIMGHSMGGHGALTLGLRHAKKFSSISAFAPIANPVACPWGVKAFTGYLGDDVSGWRAHDATLLVEDGARFPGSILIDQGQADDFLDRGQLLPDHFVSRCRHAKQPVELNLRQGYDHSYYFIATFIESHVKHHATAIRGV